MIGQPERADAAGTLTAVTAINVKNAPYNAQGNGTTDDTAAIQSALNDAAGGVLYFPPGDYLVSSPLVPQSRTLINGSHVPRWEQSDNPPSATKIRASASFSGAGLLVPAATTVSVGLHNLALVGNGVGTNVHGIRMPDSSVATDTSSWELSRVSICSFSGDGIVGRVHTWTIDGCYINNNRGWGINASGGNNWNDVHVSNCFLFYNRAGNLYFGGSKTTGSVDFVNCRFERAGAKPGDLFNPYDTSAPGVRLASANFIYFTNCDTDANCGNGFEIIHEATSPSYRPVYVFLTGCHFGRDGTGANGSTLSDFAGLKVKGTDTSSGSVNQIKAVNCSVGYGKADDAGGGTIFGPKYGVWYENTDAFQWIGGDISPSPSLSNNEFFAGAGGNTRPAIVDPLRGLQTLPVVAPNAALPIPSGAAYVDLSANRLYVRNGSAWKSVLLS